MAGGEGMAERTGEREQHPVSASGPDSPSLAANSLADRPSPSSNDGWRALCHLRPCLPPLGPAPLLFGRLPSGRLATSPRRAGAVAASGSQTSVEAVGDRVRVPVLWHAIPGGATLP